jgi:hypothetical protein
MSRDDSQNTWYKDYFGAVLCCGLAWHLHSELTLLESGAVESIRLRSGIAAMYENFGTWGPVGFFGAGALFLILKGTYRLLTK